MWAPKRGMRSTYSPPVCVASPIRPDYNWDRGRYTLSASNAPKGKSHDRHRILCTGPCFRLGGEGKRPVRSGLEKRIVSEGTRQRDFGLPSPQGIVNVSQGIDRNLAFPRCRSESFRNQVRENHFRPRSAEGGIRAGNSNNPRRKSTRIG